MSQSESPIELVRLAMQDVYQSPCAPEKYTALSNAIRQWEYGNPPPEPGEDQKIFDGLQSLISFLQKKGFNGEADDIFSLILKFFPENYFPELPRAEVSRDLDLHLFEEAKKFLTSKPHPEKLHKALEDFEEQFRRSNLNLPLLASEVASGSFQGEGEGRAGELFRSFAEAAVMLQDSAIKDIPWALMNQLAMRVNNTISGFNQAYLILKAIEMVKTARPSGWLRDEMARNEAFFLRNYCWKNIDEAVAAKDDAQIIYWIDKFLPFVKMGYERSNLLLLRQSTVKHLRSFPRSVLVAFGVMAIVMIVLSVVWLEPESKRSLNLDNARKELIQAVRTGIKPEPKPVVPQSFEPVVIEVFSRTGLREVKPPYKPHGRPLNIFEIRHVVFQRQRLNYLAEQKLSEVESARLELLEDDWRMRCNFYDYSHADREKVYWDLKIHAPTLVLDAQDILSSWRNTSFDENSAPTMQELLNLNHPFHLKLIVQRLRKLGCYTASESPKIWDENCNRALIEFKATHLSIVDSVWDRKTQNALFGQ